MKKSFFKTSIVLGFLCFSIFLFSGLNNVASAQYFGGSLDPNQARTNQVVQQQTQVGNQTSSKYSWWQEPIAGFNQVWLEGITLIITVAGYLFDQIASFTIDTASYERLQPTISAVWRLVRDVANILIVFSLLYLGIRTIYQGEGFADKKKLISILLAAVLINFSLFFTQTALQISNYAASTIKSQIQITTNVQNVGTGASTTNSSDQSLSAGIFQLLGAPKYISQISQQTQGESTNVLSTQIQFLLMLTIATLGIVFVFIAGAGILLYRFIVFLFLLILSPIGLVAFFIPFLKKTGDEWFSKLKTLTLIAPVYFLSFYVSMNLLKGVLQLSVISGSAPGSGFGTQAFGFIFQMAIQAILITGTLMGTILLPAKIASAGSGAITDMSGWASKKIRSAPARYAASGTARVSRVVGGRVGSTLTNGDGKFGKYLQTKARTGGIIGKTLAGRTIKAGAGLKNSTFDIRNVGMIKKTKFGKEMGTGIKTWDAAVKEKKENYEKKKKNEMKVFGYDQFDKDPEQKAKVITAKTARDAYAAQLKSAKIDVQSRHASATEDERKRDAEILQEMEKEMEKLETDVGAESNKGESEYLKKMENSLMKKYTPIHNAARKEMAAETRKRWKKDGQSSAKKARSNASATPSTTPPANPPPTPPPANP